MYRIVEWSKWVNYYIVISNCYRFFMVRTLMKYFKIYSTLLLIKVISYINIYM